MLLEKIGATEELFRSVRLSSFLHNFIVITNIQYIVKRGMYGYCIIPIIMEVIQ